MERSEFKRLFLNTCQTMSNISYILFMYFVDICDIGSANLHVLYSVFEVV